MNKCPYTWFIGKLGRSKTISTDEAQNLRVLVMKENEEKVNVFLPAVSARWLIDLIPSDVMQKIREEGIPIESIQNQLIKTKKLMPKTIFNLEDGLRKVHVWLE